MESMDVRTAQLILVLYVIFNTVRVFSYLPQIFTVAKEKSAVTAISLLTWWMWTGANFISGVYASFITPDLWLALTSYANAVGCLAVISCVIYKRRKYGAKTVFVETELEKVDSSEVVKNSSKNAAVLVREK